MGIGELIFCVAILSFGIYRMRYAIDTLQTPAFIVFGNQPIPIPTANAAICGHRAPASGFSFPPSLIS